MKRLKEVKTIVVHHSQTDQHSLKSIKSLHKHHGWEDIGYHYLIGNGKASKDGKLYKGRSEKYMGGHVKDYNKNSIGICMIGNLNKKPPTKKQIQTLIKFLRRKMKKHEVPTKNVLGHREFQGVRKTCPGKFTDMNKIRKILEPKT